MKAPLMDKEVILLAQSLVKRPSISPKDKGCQPLIIDYLKSANFEHVKICKENTVNSWLYKGNLKAKPHILLLGHTDVVPEGPLNQWDIPPFEGKISNLYLHGRGSIDMKGALAAMVVAAKKLPNYHKGLLSILITSDEEDTGLYGTCYALNKLSMPNVDYCIVGEPTSEKEIGDVIKNGRRGSLNFTLKIYGKQGHVAYPHLAENPIHISIPYLKRLIEEDLDNGQKHKNFPPTNLQITSVESSTFVSNLIPYYMIIRGNIRFNPLTTTKIIKSRIKEILEDLKIKYSISWQPARSPFFTSQNFLSKVVTRSISTVRKKFDMRKITTRLETTGGTSDAGFVYEKYKQNGVEIIELGAINKLAHKANERVSLLDLTLLREIYSEILRDVLF